MKSGEYGIVFNINIGSDISTATEYGIEFTKPDGTTLTVLSADGVTIGAVPLAADCDQTYAADEYLIYTTVDGDIDQSGTWTLRSLITIGSQYLKGGRTSFIVYS